jgi:hypothetical protein
MTDIASLVLAVDATQVDKGVLSLHNLSAAGARAEVATLNLGRSTRGAAAEATAMAAAAQATARAATNLTTNFTASANAARLNTMAMRETLVVARELSRGNFTRLPGSLTLLAQGISSQGQGISGFVASLGQTLGLIKTLQSAELAEEAANAAAAAAAVQSAAKRAAAAVTAADTELALAEAQLRVTEGTTAEAAAQVRLAEAHAAVSAAAGDAAIAEEALAVAAGRAEQATAAAAATATTSLTPLGAAFAAITAAAGFALAGFEGFKSEVKDSGDLDRYADGLRLTKSEIEKAGGSVTYLGHNIEEVHGLTITFGDAFHGTMSALSEAAGVSSDNFRHFWVDALLQVAQVGVSAAQTIAGAFSAAGSFVNSTKNLAVGIVNPSLMGAGLSSTNNPEKIARDAANAFKNTFADVGKFFHVTLPNSIENAAKDRLKKLSDSNNPAAPKKPRKPKEAPTDEFDSLSARLDEEILNAKKSLAGSVEEQAKFALQEVDVETKKTVDNAKQLLAKHRLTVGEEQHVELQAHELASLKKQLILRDEATKLLTQAQAAQDQLFGFQIDALKFADEMARTQHEHRAAQFAMLDIAYQQKKYDLQILEAKQKLAGDLAAAAITQAQINNLPTQQARDVAVTVRKTMDPLEQWKDSVPHTADDIIDQLQRIETQGFDSLAQGIAGVITGTESMGQAFKDMSQQIVGDLIQVIVKMLIVRALTAAFGGFDQASFAGTVASNNAALGGPLVGMPSASLPGFATGGIINVGGNGGVDNNVLSLNGSPVARVSQGESLAVFPRGRPANSNAPVEVHVTVDASPELDARIVSVSAKTTAAGISQAAPVIVKAAVQGTMKATGRPRLMGR